MTNPKYTTWRKSTRSGSPNGNCVEVAVAIDHTVGVRDSKNQTGPILEFDPQQWSTFVAAVQAGEFDQPAE